jgi:SAM-dependent methyltransferase
MANPKLIGGEIPVSPWVERFLAGAPKDRPVLDVACGAGRHTRLAAGRGYKVTAVDRAPEILDEFADDPLITPIVRDLEDGWPWPFQPNSFGAVIVTNYLHRPLLNGIAASLDDGGILIYETFARGHERYRKPSRPEFLLQPNELARMALDAGLTIVAFEQGERASSGPTGGAGIIQRIAAVGPAHPWAEAQPLLLPS